MKSEPLPPTTLTVKGAKTQVTLCQCLRCGNIWKPHKPNPAKCAACFSPLWNKPRVYRVEGAEEPTGTAKPRGKPFQPGFDERRGERNPRGAGRKSAGKKAV